jgi:pyruvate,water dikinase
MFPGACTPLSFSFTARGIDVGMQRMHQRIGIRREISEACVFVGMFHRHLFLNLTTTADTATQALGSSADQMALSICGRPITEFEIHESPPPPLPRRLRNGFRYVRYLLGQRGARRQMHSLRASLGGLAVDASETEARDAREQCRQMWETIDAHFEAIYEAMDLHLISSAGSGVLSTVLLALIAKGETPSDEQHAQVAGLLAGAEGVESADIAAGADRIRDAVCAHPDADGRFASAEAERALAWLESEDSGEAGETYRGYLERHGHRTVKELELRQPEWSEEPLPLVRSLQAAVRALLAQRAKHAADLHPHPHDATLPEAEEVPRAGVGMRILTRMARQAVRSREETKSGLVDVTTHFKRAYRALGRAATRADLLPDPDAVFFLTHEELGRLVSGEDPSLSGLAKLASSRRQLHPDLDRLSFPDVFAGAGEPELPEAPAAGTTCVTGAPVSRGRVEGIARVVHSLEEAEALQDGEILVAPITDVGWTPYFSVVAGLVTDVGSAVSHGAVVAREYGLPAVVNTRHATSVFRTGDRLRLDGERGIVEIVETREPDH